MLRRGLARLAAAAVCAAVATSAVPARAADPAPGPGGDRDAVLAQVRAEMAESSEAMVQAAAQLRRAQATLPGARRTAAAARDRLQAAEVLEQAAARRRGQAQTTLMMAAQDAERTAAQVAEQRADLGRVARAAYQRGGSIGEVSVLLSATSPSDFTDRLVTLRTVVSAQHATLERLQEAQVRDEARQGALERFRDRVAVAHEDAQARSEAVAELSERAVAAQAEVSRLVRDQSAALAAARAAVAEDERRLRELRGESSQLQAELAQRARTALGAAGGRSGSSLPVRPGLFVAPVQAPVTSPFGMRTHPITGVHKLHTGTDFGAPCGTAVAAARAGVVVSSGYNRAYGWRVVVSHGVVAGALLTTTYNHLQGPGAQPGQQVAAGDVVGHVGTTGYSTGCHLHFELIVNSDFVDPAPWLAG
jgi:murein DD-endopeptidase MepM/ murein hydrolase activator NlpD